jgi:hypothetical protein
VGIRNRAHVASIVSDLLQRRAAATAGGATLGGGGGDAAAAAADGAPPGAEGAAGAGAAAGAAGALPLTFCVEGNIRAGKSTFLQYITGQGLDPSSVEVRARAGALASGGPRARPCGPPAPQRGPAPWDPGGSGARAGAPARARGPPRPRWTPPCLAPRWCRSLSSSGSACRAAPTAHSICWT